MHNVGKYEKEKKNIVFKTSIKTVEAPEMCKFMPKLEMFPEILNG